MEYTIYSITSQNVDVTGIYVGSTNDLDHRKSVHKYDSKNETKTHMKLYKCNNENGGWENWEFKILEIFKCDFQYEAFIKERYYIDKLQADLIHIGHILQEKKLKIKGLNVKRKF